MATGLAPALLCVACYVYRPAGEVAPAAGVEIRAQLTPPASFRLGEFTINDVERVEGQVSQANGDSLWIWGTWLRTRIGSRYHANYGVLVLDRGQVGELEVRRFSAARTAAGGVVAAGILVALFRVVEGAFGGSGAPGPPGDPQ